jgi:hypothetical protein
VFVLLLYSIDLIFVCHQKLYDCNKASPETYVLAAAHIIEYAVHKSGHINVTVLVHTNRVPGAPNQTADMNFIKKFIQVVPIGKPYEQTAHTDSAILIAHTDSAYWYTDT